jgi:hypothetical protein
MRYRQLGDQSPRVLKFALTLSGKSHHDIGANCHPRHQLRQGLHQPAIVGSSILAVHGAQDTIIAALERYVEMPAQPPSKQCGDLSGYLPRFNGAEPYARFPAVPDQFVQ